MDLGRKRTPPPPPCTQNDVTVTINQPLLHTHWPDPPSPIRCVRTYWTLPAVELLP